MSILRDKQVLLARLVPRLLDKAFSLGFEVALGETLRSESEARRLAKAKKGILNSLHRDGLAIDLKLFRDGIYLTDTEDHFPLGLYWESLNLLCRWGGRFGDGNHYSIEHLGRK